MIYVTLTVLEAAVLQPFNTQLQCAQPDGTCPRQRSQYANFLSIECSTNGQRSDNISIALASPPGSGETKSSPALWPPSPQRKYLA